MLPLIIEIIINVITINKSLKAETWTMDQNSLNHKSWMCEPPEILLDYFLRSLHACFIILLNMKLMNWYFNVLL